MPMPKATGERAQEGRSSVTVGLDGFTCGNDDGHAPFRPVLQNFGSLRTSDGELVMDLLNDRLKHL